MIVVDTNVIAYLWLKGEFTTQAEAALRIDSDWLAPHLWRSEFRNVLATYVRAKRFESADAVSAIGNAEAMMKGHEYWVASAAVLQLAFDSNVSAYDCEFVAVANELNCPLVTSDQKLVKAFPARAVHLAEFAA